jgi:uncharacterized protein (DUF2336 family)
VEAERSLIAELESAVASSSSDKRVETLRRVTDLFMISAENYSASQVDIFDDVISRLAERIEMKARAELANRLAPVRNAPPTIMRTLARDAAIEVAGPVLTHSTRLTEEDLLACAEGKSQERLLAISKRASISEVLSEVLVRRGDHEVVRSVARNEGARFSDAGYGKLVERSAADDELAVSVGMRKDIPKEHFHALVAKASEAVFKKLTVHNPAAVNEVSRVLFDLTGRKASEPFAPGGKIVRDYSEARATFEALRSRLQTEAAVRQLASTGRIAETIAAIATLCNLPPEAVDHIVADKQSDADLMLLLIKATGLSWSTAKLILQLRAGEGGLAAATLDSAHRRFERLQLSTAQRVVRFYQIRHTSGPKGPVAPLSA